MTLHDLQLELHARRASWCVQSDMKKDWTQVTELRLEHGRFMSLHVWLFDYRGLKLLDDGLL